MLHSPEDKLGRNVSIKKINEKVITETVKNVSSPFQ